MAQPAMCRECGQPHWATGFREAARILRDARRYIYPDLPAHRFREVFGADIALVRIRYRAEGW